MRKLSLFILVWSLASGAPVFAGERNVRSVVTLESGFRSDRLDWNIAGTTGGTNPNVLSELQWRDLHIAQLRLKTELDFELAGLQNYQPHLRGQLGFGQILSGENQDSDYNGDNRTLEFSRSNNGADQGEVYDLAVGFGPRILLMKTRLTLIPLVGYSWHVQNLKLLDANQTVSSSETPPLGPFPGLDSSYDADWRGPWIGVEMKWVATQHLILKALTEYHSADYSAEANWNLRGDLAHPLSFEQGANGQGWVNEIGLEYDLRDNWSFALSGKIQSWTTDPGYDLVYLADGTTQLTRLNQVNWDSVSIHAGLNYHF